MFVVNDKTTDDRQTDCLPPFVLLYLPISQAYLSILPSDAVVYLLVKYARVWYGGPLIAAGDHLWHTQDVRGDHLWWHKWSWGMTCVGGPVNSLQAWYSAFDSIPCSAFYIIPPELPHNVRGYCINLRELATRDISSVTWITATPSNLLDLLVAKRETTLRALPSPHALRHVCFAA